MSHIFIVCYFSKPLVFSSYFREWLAISQVSFTLFSIFLDCISLPPLQLGLAVWMSKWASGMLANTLCTNSSHGTCQSSMRDLPCSLPSCRLDANGLSNLGSHVGYGKIKIWKERECWFSTGRRATCWTEVPAVNFVLGHFVHSSSWSYLNYHTSLHKWQRKAEVSMRWKEKSYFVV